MSSDIRTLSRRINLCLYSFGGYFAVILFLLALYLFLGGRQFLQAFIEKCLAQCSALMTLSFSALGGIRLVLVFGLLGLFSLALAKSLSDVRRVRRFTRSLQTMEMPPRFGRLLKDCGLPPDRAFLFPSWLSFACTAGLFSPRIYVSTRLFDSLGDEEVKAVLQHEQGHAQRKDPLRGMLIGLFSRFFFFIPPARRWLRRAKRDLELVADAHCLAFSHSPDTLASALVKARRDNQVRTRVMTGFAGEDFLDERLNLLLNLKNGSATPGRTRRRTLGQTAAGLALALALAFLILPLGHGFPKASPWVCRHDHHESCCPSGGEAGAHDHCRSELGGMTMGTHYR
jgi:Zn-dependent protease with chaperone function